MKCSRAVDRDYRGLTKVAHDHATGRSADAGFALNLGFALILALWAISTYSGFPIQPLRNRLRMKPAHGPANFWVPFYLGPTWRRLMLELAKAVSFLIC